MIGGRGPTDLARRMLVLDLRTQRWHTAPGPAPREHLAATALGGVVYAVGGRLAGDDTNLALLEGFAGGHWSPLPPIPAPRGGTGVAPLAGRLVSIGGEEPAGTIASVYAFDPRTRTWAHSFPIFPPPATGSASSPSAAVSGRSVVDPSPVSPSPARSSPSEPRRPHGAARSTASVHTWTDLARR